MTEITVFPREMTKNFTGEETLVHNGMKDIEEKNEDFIR